MNVFDLWLRFESLAPWLVDDSHHLSQFSMIPAYGYRFWQLSITKVGHFDSLARLYSFFYKPLYKFLNTIGKEEVLPNSKINEVLGRTVCTLSPLACELGAFFMCGEDFQGFNRSRAPMYFSHYPTGLKKNDTPTCESIFIFMVLSTMHWRTTSHQQRLTIKTHSHFLFKFAKTYHA